MCSLRGSADKVCLQFAWLSLSDALLNYTVDLHKLSMVPKEAIKVIAPFSHVLTTAPSLTSCHKWFLVGFMQRHKLEII